MTESDLESLRARYVRSACRDVRRTIDADEYVNAIREFYKPTCPDHDDVYLAVDVGDHLHACSCGATIPAGSVIVHYRKPNGGCRQSSAVATITEGGRLQVREDAPVRMDTLRELLADFSRRGL